MMIGVDMGDGTILVVRDSLLTGSEPPLTMYELAIGRLTAQLADLQTIYSATRSDNISMTEQLAEAREREAGMTEMYEELHEHHFKEHHTPDYVKIEELENQLAEARAEVERYNAGVEVEGYVAGVPTDISNDLYFTSGWSKDLAHLSNKKVRVLIMKLEG